MKETDLYLPIKSFLEQQGYEVKGEVHQCDVLAVRGEELPVVVELKLALNLGVVLQAVDRLSLTPKVYIGVAANGGSLKSKPKQVVKLLRMLGLGLLVVDRAASSEVEVMIDPGEYRPRASPPRRERLLGEFARRVGDPNLGGADRRRGVMTAYRQRALVIATHLRNEGPSRAADVAQALEESEARNILYRDVYGWFDRVSRGVYTLSPRGEREISLWEDQGT